MNVKSWLLGFFIGGAAAGISVLLTAPNSGKETRQYVREQKESIQKQILDLNKQLIELKNSTIKASKEGKNTISAFSSEVKTSIQKWRDEILPHQQDLQKELHSIELAILDLEKSIEAKIIKK
ncbi:YtxH domain-containing protein [Cytobacillus dafuensis]|uniref:YtxH domain-containing protein n=1 Tax=Cytobacillus dafuensis TaxID=1742359 RepID=A0A5B8Z264_CYTDA|nr:YtxH domain-containing protein [Cytobacillus dafuensis]QED47132.1 YtxH domain-containing protein [Cytobacillus dafuensis]